MHTSSTTEKPQQPKRDVYHSSFPIAISNVLQPTDEYLTTPVSGAEEPIDKLSVNTLATVPVSSVEEQTYTFMVTPLTNLPVSSVEDQQKECMVTPLTTVPISSVEEQTDPTIVTSLDIIPVSNVEQPTDKRIVTPSTNVSDVVQATDEFTGHDSYTITNRAIAYPCLYYATMNITKLNSLKLVHTCITCRMAVNISINRMDVPVCTSHICRTKSCMKNVEAVVCLCQSHCVAMGVCCANYLSTCMPIWNEDNTSMSFLNKLIRDMSSQSPVLGAQYQYRNEVKRCAPSPYPAEFAMNRHGSTISNVVIDTHSHTLHRYIKCTPVTVENANYRSYLMISECPIEVTEELKHHKYRCLNPSARTETYVQYISAQSIVIINNHVFRNIYCAHCHGVKVTNPKYLTPRINCDQTNSSYLSEMFLKGSKATFDMFMTDCTWFHSNSGRDAELLELRGYLCPPVDNYITQCNHSLSSTVDNFASLNNVCMMYRSNMALLSSIRSAEYPSAVTIYKNAHCALCNGIINLQELACLAPLFDSPAQSQISNIEYKLRSFFLIFDLARTIQSVPELKLKDTNICLGSMLLDISTNKCVYVPCVADASNCSHLPQTRKPRLNNISVESFRNNINQSTVLFCVYEAWDESWDIKRIVAIFTWWLTKCGMMVVWYDGVHTSINHDTMFFHGHNSSTCFRYICNDQSIFKDVIVDIDTILYFKRIAQIKLKYIGTGIHMRQIVLLNYNKTLEQTTSDVFCDPDTHLVKLTNFTTLISNMLTSDNFVFASDEYPQIHDANALIEVNLFEYKFLGKLWDKTIAIQTCIPRVLMCDKVVLPNGTFELTNYALSYLSVDVQLKGDGSFYEDNGSLITCRDDIHVKNSHVPNHQDDIVHRILSIVCLTVSLIGLSCTISIHLLTPNLRKSIPAQLLMNYSIALLMAQLLFLLGGIVQL